LVTYREQTVDIALGPKGAFENGNVGAVTRRVATDRIVTAAPARRGTPRPPREPRPPRVVEFLRNAMEWQTLLDDGEFLNQAAIARREGITRARVTQVMGLLRLTPEIQERVLSLTEVSGRHAITERVRRPIAQMQDPRAQWHAYSSLES
jgi:hypothetical protein